MTEPYSRSSDLKKYPVLLPLYHILCLEFYIPSIITELIYSYMRNITHTTPLQYLLTSGLSEFAQSDKLILVLVFPFQGYWPLFSEKLWLTKIFAKENGVFSANPSNKPDNIRHFLKVGTVVCLAFNIYRDKALEEPWHKFLYKNI